MRLGDDLFYFSPSARPWQHRKCSKLISATVKTPQPWPRNWFWPLRNTVTLVSGAYKVTCQLLFNFLYETSLHVKKFLRWLKFGQLINFVKFVFTTLVTSVRLFEWIVFEQLHGIYKTIFYCHWFGKIQTQRPIFITDNCREMFGKSLPQSACFML